MPVSHQNAPVDRDATLKEIARYYIVTVLKENSYVNLANQFPPLKYPNQNIHRLINDICTQLVEERAEMFNEIIVSLTITNDNLEDTYKQLMTHIFQEGVNWGRIITFLVFSGRLSLHCARCGMQNRVREIIKWEMYGRISSWVMERGGWNSFVPSYEDDSWNVSLALFLVVTGEFAVVFASGIFLARRFLF